MSTEIDENIVRMQFDNRRFEQGVQETILTLDKLKKSLVFDNSIFYGFEKTAVSAVNNVSSSFSKLEVVAVGALMNIGAKAATTFENIIKSLSVDNIAAGWNKFGEKTTSVGTLISQGYNMDEVNEQLDRLNWYTDETSYNFTDMVSNISKFTSTGQDLETSVTAMMGIANWAALSGQNANVASRAMYQLSQAMGAGVMRLEDYKSIQNVSMDTDEFRQKALDAAVALGTLQKNADGTYQSLVGNSTKFTKTQFTTMLTQGRWFTSDVMMEVYGQYGSVIDQIRDYAEENGITASEAMEELGDELEEFGLKAFKSAQEARTFSDALDATKDAVSTGWMNTFTLIFGNYEQAKQLWTKLANELYDVFAEGGNERNEILKSWNEMGGRMDFLQSLWNGFHNLVNILNAVKEGFYAVFPPMTGEKLHSITAALKELSEKLYLNETHLHVVKTVFQGLFSVIDIVYKIIKSVVKGFSPVIEPLKELGYYIEAVAYYIAKTIINIDSGVEEFNSLETVVGSIVTLVGKFIGFGLKTVLTGIVNVIAKIVPLLDKTSTTGTVIGTAMVSGPVGTIFDALLDKVNLIINTIKAKVAQLFSFISVITTKNEKSSESSFTDRINAILDLFEPIKNKIADFLRTIKENLKLSDFSEFSKTLLTFVSIAIQVVNAGTFAQIAIGIKNITSSFSKINDGVTKVLTSVQDTLEAYQKRLKAKVLNTIANAILKLTVSLIALSMLDHQQLATGLIGLGAILAGFTIVATKLVKLTTNITKLKNMKLIIEYLVGISSSVLMMSVAMRIIAALDMEQMIVGLIGTIGLMSGVVLMIVGIAEVLKRIDGMEKISTKFLAITASLLLIAHAVNSLLPSIIAISLLDPLKAAQGFAVTVGIMGGLTLMLLAIGETIRRTYRVASMGSQFAAISASLILIALSINAFMPSIIGIGAMNTEDALQGFAVIFGIMSSMVLVLLSVSEMLRRTRRVHNVASSVMAMGVMILEMTVAVDAIAPAVLMLGSMSVDQVVQGFAVIFGIMSSMVLTLVSVSEMLRITRKVHNIAATVLSMGAIILSLAASIDILVPAIITMGSMNPDDLNQGIVALLKILTELAFFFMGIQVLGKSNPKNSATTVLALSAALNMIVFALTAFGEMNVKTLDQGLVALLKVLSELAFFFMAVGTFPNSTMSAANILAITLSLVAIALVFRRFTFTSLAAIPIAVMLSAILAFAKGMAVIGPKLTLAAPGMVAFAGSMALLGLAMTLFNGAIITFGASVGVWTAALMEISKNAKELGEAIVNIMDETVKVLEPAMVLIARLVADIFLALIEGLLESLYVYTDPIVRNIMEILIIICDVLGETVGPLVDAIVRLAIDILVDAIETLADVVYRDGERILVALLHVVDAVYLLVARLLGADSDALKTYLDAGRKMMSEWTEQFTAFISVMTVCIGVLIASLTGLIGPVGVTISVLLILVATFGYLQNEFGNIGGGIAIAIGGIVLAIMGILGPLDLLVVAIAAVAWAFKDEIAKFLVDSYYFLKGYFEYVGENICDFFENLWKSISEYFSGLWNDLKEIGEFLIEGLVEGLNSAKEKVVGAVTWVGNDIVNRFKKVFKVESPSKVTKEIGGFLDSGLSSGILSGRKDVIKSLNSVGTDMIESFRNVVGVHSDSTETKEIGGFLDTGLISGIQEKAPAVFDAITNFGSSIMERFGISLDGKGIAETFLGDFQTGIEEADEIEFTNESAKEAYKRMLERAASRGKFLASEQGKAGLTSEEIIGANEASRLAAAAAARAQGIKMVYQSGTLNSYDEKVVRDEKFSIADSILSSLGSDATWDDIRKALRTSNKFSNKDIEEYVEHIKENGEKAEEINDATEAAIDPLQQALEHARELSSKFSEAKKQFDEIHSLYKEGFLGINNFTMLYGDILDQYPEVHDKLLEYINKQIGVSTDAALEAAKKMSERVSEAKKAFDDLYTYYKEGYLKKDDFDRLLNNMYTEYSDISEIFTKYVYEKMGGVIDEALEAAKKMSERVSEAKKAFDDLYTYYKEGYLKKDDFDRLLNNMYTEYSDISEIFTKYVYEKMGGVIDEALDAAEKVANRQSEAKKKLDSIFDYYADNLITDEDMERIISKWMENYSDIADYAEKYLTEKMESIDSKIIEAAKKQSKRISDFKSKFDDIFDSYQDNLISFAAFESESRELVRKYADLGTETTDYINSKIKDSDNSRLEEATGYFDKIYDYYQKGLIAWEEFEDTWTKIVETYSDKRVKLWEHAGEKMLEGEYEQFSVLFELYNSNMISPKMFLDELDKLYDNTLDGGAQLHMAVDNAIANNISEQLSDLSDAYKEKLSDIIKNIETFADNLHMSLSDAFDLKSSKEEIEKFSDKVHTSFSDSFATKTNKEVYDETSNEFEKKLKSLNEELDETSEKFGSTSMMAEYYRKEISKVTDEYDKYKKSYEKSNLDDNAIAKVTFGEDVEKELKEIEEYNSELDKLKVRGISNEFYTMLSEKGREEGLAIVKYLNSLSQEEYNAIATKYKQLTEASNKLASNMYSDPNSVFNFRDNLKKELEELRKYKDNLNKLIDRDILSDDMLDYIRSLSREEASALIDGLNAMSDAEITDIQDTWATIQDESMNISSSSFDDEIKDANKELVKGMLDIYDGLPDEMKDIGYRTIMSFIEGVGDGTAVALSMLNNSAYATGISTFAGSSDDLNKLEIDNEKLSESLGYNMEKRQREYTNSPAYKKKVDEVLTTVVSNMQSAFSNYTGLSISKGLYDKFQSGEILIYVNPDVDLEIKETVKPVVDMNDIPYTEDMLNASNSLYRNMSSYIGLMSMQSMGELLKDNRPVIEDIRDKMDDLSQRFETALYAVSNARIIMDANQLSSKLAPSMNGSLGRLVIQRSR